MIKPMLAVIALAVSLLAASVANAQGYGGLYVNGGAAAQALSTSAAKITGFTAATAKNDDDTSVVPVAASDHITLLAGGVYLIHFDCSAIIGTADITVTYSLRNGATAITGAQCSAHAITGMTTRPVNSSMSFVYAPTSNATLSVYAASASGTPNLTPVDANLIVHRIK